MPTQEIVRETAFPRVCPRCRGPMFLEEDWYGVYRSCVCCGYVHEFKVITAEDLAKEAGRLGYRHRNPSHQRGSRRVRL